MIQSFSIILIIFSTIDAFQDVIKFSEFKQFYKLIKYCFCTNKTI